MAAITWLSVIARRGAVIVYPRTVRCWQWTDTFGMVIKNVGFDEEMVKEVQISNNEKQQLCHIVELNSPVLICEQFHCHFVCYNLLEQELQKKTAVTET